MATKKISIAESGGLEKHLERTMGQHNGLGYNIFRLCVNTNVSRSNIARLFNVDHRTIKKWAEVLEEESHVG